MKSKLVVKILFIIFSISLSLACVTSVGVNAATHSHSIACYKEVAHQHKGSSTAGGGCYTAALCGGSFTRLNDAYGVCACGSTRMTMQYRCNKCQRIKTVEARHSCNYVHYDNIVVPSTCDYEASPTSYVVSCGMTAGVSYANFYHTHEGDTMKRTGCYTGTATYGDCKGTYVSHVITEEMNDVNCWTHSGTCYSDRVSVTLSCGHVVDTSFRYCSYCNGNINTYKQNYYNNTIKEKTCIITGVYSYALNCGLDETTLYDCNNTPAVLACDNKIKSITAKQKTQTIIK